MQNDPTTNNTHTKTPELELDRQDWELAFEPFKENSYAALTMGFTLAAMRSDLDGLLIKPRPVMEALDLAMEVLFPYTDFYKASFGLFLKFTEGKLTLAEEQMLNALGVKF